MRFSAARYKAVAWWCSQPTCLLCCQQCGGGRWQRTGFGAATKCDATRACRVAYVGSVWWRRYSCSSEKAEPGKLRADAMQPTLSESTSLREDPKIAPELCREVLERERDRRWHLGLGKSVHLKNVGDSTDIGPSLRP
ncbi:hypothetical protein NPIL_565951 [Nephila pilipes]|uniref:Uncharacterized protein n=1 Tax=Nephila pilipes TaxID=299642 RepID=A0A8X6R519_NEPPI|nr:hypothetical protein NPIL_565951 [Nephila pilipes]